MSDRMSVAEAREWLPMAESYDVNANISRLLRTTISQAEQIERLQDGLYKADKWGGEVLNNLIEDDIILPGDMEPPEGLTRKGM
ncbi:MAG: hypothetical protein PHW63_09870 [Alphaproteobacteria bacterium]|nr:hypothetical protein [Alphaproteobacteria bacterium]